MGSLLGVIAYGANFAVAFIKWAALLFVVIKIVMLGFKILTQAKDGADAIGKIKNEGLALVIGLFVVLSAFLIHDALKGGITSITTGGSGATTELTVDGTDNIPT